MCGRDFLTSSSNDLKARYLTSREWPCQVNLDVPDIKPNYNICPTQLAPVVRIFDTVLSIELMRWGLVPSWATSVKDADKYAMINARSEEIMQKRSYKAAYQRRRCIIPVSGFFEWLRKDKIKIPYVIKLIDDQIMSIGGIWECWESSETGEVVQSFCIITKAANEHMQNIHDRMPLIISRQIEMDWLDPKITDPKTISQLIEYTSNVQLETYEVSTRVNSIKNNSSENIIKLQKLSI